MMPRPPLLLDSRRATDMVAALRQRRPGYVPEWDPADESRGPDTAISFIWARYLEAILERLNRAPEKHKLAFLETMGIELIPAQSARAPVVFQLGADSTPTRLPAGAQFAAPPPPEGSSQIVFETERAVGLTPARLQQVFSVWPGRDQYIDHSEDFLAGDPIRPFLRSDLQDIPHIIYIAHDTLLALDGSANVNVDFELTQAANETLDILWEYWDGAVWRGFKRQHPECAERDEEKLDGTAGLTRTGRVQLESECATSAKSAVNGIEAFWIRGKLDERLPLDPGQILPEVSQIQLSTVIKRAPAIKAVKATYEAARGGTTSAIECVVVVQDSNGLRLEDVAVAVNGVEKETRSGGKVTFPNLTAAIDGTYSVEISIEGAELTYIASFNPSKPVLVLEITLDLGIQPDEAFAGPESLDVTKPFYPFGQNPGPGSTFYFASEEVFTKPGAQLVIHVQEAKTPQDSFQTTPDDTTSGTVRWEYYNGREWLPLAVEASDEVEEPIAVPASPSKVAMLNASGTLKLTVPDDFAVTSVNDTEALWIRARLLTGAFGFTKEVGVGSDNTMTIFIPQPPALADLRLSYTWEYGPFHAEHVLAYNDFQYDDFTERAKWPDTPFQPFQQLADSTPALYLGFDKDLPVDRLNIFFDVVEQHAAADNPALLWEYWRSFDWQRMTVDDGTNDLRYPETVSFIGPEDAAALARFGEKLYWLRARLAEDGPPPQPIINGIYPNAAWASQRQTITNENLGRTTGRPNEVFTFRRIPVLDGEQVEVRELTGARAGVEWRIAALELFGEDYRRLRDIEDRLASEAVTTDVIDGDLRLKRDRTKNVSEVWVRWWPRRHLLASSATDRHFVLERARGRLLFGDGEHGRLLPPGGEIEARQYRTGGGVDGNVAANSITQALAGVAGLESVFNPRPAEGGSDGETLGALSIRGPHLLRSRGRALTPGDFETMAKEASPAVAVARVLAARDGQGRPRPGWVTLIIIPRSAEPRPWPSFGLREKVRRAIEERAPAELADAHQLYVTGPEYQAVAVEAVIAPLDAQAAGTVEAAVRAALENFLHPLLGGPEGRGWEEGRDVYLSDVAAVLERIKGVDYARELRLYIDGRLQGEQARVPTGKTVVAGEIQIKLVM